MTLILHITIILSWILLIYLPLCAAYFAFGIAFAKNPETIWRKPFLGIHQFSTKIGSLIWMAQLAAFGIAFYQYNAWLRFGICPFIEL
jgi:hypothetical protein